MANLDQFNEFSKLFQKHIQDFNATSIGKEIKNSQTDKIANAYQKIKNSMDILLSQYLNLGKKQKDVADTFVQTLMYLVYQTSFSKSFEEYKAASEFITTLFDDSSDLAKLLKLIEAKIVIMNTLFKPSFKEPGASGPEYDEWLGVKTEVKILLEKLFNLLKSLLVSLGILPEGFVLEQETVDEQGNPVSDGKWTVSAKGARSLSKKFGKLEKYFEAYLGQINRRGYVAQKAQVYMQIPLLTNGTAEKKIDVSIPLMDISNITFNNDPKNIIFGIFNMWDYVGKVLVENEDDEEKSAYVYKDSKIRFGGIFSSKDISHTDSKQSFRLNYCDEGWTYGTIKRKGVYTIEDVKFTCKFGDKDYYEDPSQYPLDCKLCDKIEFKETVRDTRSNEIFNFTGELTYDEDYTNEQNNQEALLQQNSKSSSYAAPTVTVSREIVNDQTVYYWKLNDQYIFNNKENARVDNVGGGTENEWVEDLINGLNEGSTNITMPKSSIKNGKYALLIPKNRMRLGFKTIVTDIAASGYTAISKSYFKGTLKLESNEDTDDENSFMSDYTASKDVIMEFKRLNSSSSNGKETGTFDVKCYLDPESQSNQNYSEDDENSPKVFLPPLVSNFDIKNVKMSGNLDMSVSSELTVAEALLNLSKLDIDNFNDLDYSELVNKVKSAKSNLIADLLAKIGALNSLITTIVTAGSLFQAYDNLYISDFTEDILNTYADIQSTFETYLSTDTYDIAELYNGVFAAKIDKGITDIDIKIGENIDDTLESERIFHNYENKLSFLVNSPKLGITFNSPLSCVYDILTGESTTITTMISSGQTVKIYNIQYSYLDWLNLYTSLPAKRELSKYYFIESSLLQYLYIITQLYKHYKDGNQNNVKKVNLFLRELVLRMLTDNVYNAYFDDVYNPRVKDILLQYVDISELVDCDDFNFNTYFLNPYYSEVFPELEKFNKYNINDSDQLQENNMRNMCKALLYKSILNTPSDRIHNKLESIYKFINNGQKLNIRELIFKYNFYDVLKLLHNEIADSRYHIDISNCDDEMKSIKNIINSILNYKLLLSDTGGNPISKLLNVTYTPEPISTTDENGNKTYTVDVDGESIDVTEEEDVRVLTLTLPKLLMNNYTYNPVEDNSIEYINTTRLTQKSSRANAQASSKFVKDVVELAS